jgi:hypothetical protein
MGRYYSGDIEGKFWFGVQSSLVGSERFGCVESNPDIVELYADEDMLPTINEELKNIENKMGDQLAKYDDFFNNAATYTGQKMEDAGLDTTLIEDYADYGFGIKLRDCILEHGSCNFTAEL